MTLDASRQPMQRLRGRPSDDPIEATIQRWVFTVVACIAVGVGTVYIAALLWQGLGVYAGLMSAMVAVALGSALWARRSGRHAGPLGVLLSMLFGVLAYGTLHQDATLPAAGWWLSIVPFMFAGAGLFRMAIGSVLAFVAIVSWLHLAAGSPPFPVEAVITPLRRYAAVVGSELVALSLIIIAMQRRSQVARALEAARAEASAAAAAQARFLAHMSHEVRTPLNGIIGTTELLDSASLSDEQRVQLMGLQRQSAKTLLALVNDVLDFAKLDAGKVSLEQQPVALHELVFESNELFSVAAFSKGIELSSSCGPEVPEQWLGDPVRLRQIVNNLVGNAVKFTATGGVHIHLSLEPLDPRDPPLPQGLQTVRIEVADSGPGIAQAQHARLFQAFTQADTSVTRRFGGTGLGLSIAQELAQLMDGRIELASTLGQGSRFSLVVPLRVAAPHVNRPLPLRRSDIVLAVANAGLARHIGALLAEARIDPVSLQRLPDEAELAACRLLLVDAPLLQATEPSQWLRQQAAAGRQVIVLTPLGDDTVVGAPAHALLLYKPVRRKSLQAALATLNPQAQAPAAEPPADTSPATQGLRVLVADDNPVNQVVVEAMLTELGASCVMAGNGHEALAHATRDRFDLVLMDLQMPELDGLSATRRLREHEAAQARPRLPVIAMTAHAERAEGAACTAAGMDGFLTKPFGLLQLRRCLEALRTLPA
jgi:signal transduction histidine kinase/CheY-like chemotaxis protein